MQAFQLWVCHVVVLLLDCPATTLGDAPDCRGSFAIVASPARRNQGPWCEKEASLKMPQLEQPQSPMRLLKPRFWTPASTRRLHRGSCAVGHGSANGRSTRGTRNCRRQGTKGLHLAFCVVVDEARVAGDALRRRRGCGNGDGISVLSAGHHEGQCFDVLRLMLRNRDWLRCEVWRFDPWRYSPTAGVGKY